MPTFGEKVITMKELNFIDVWSIILYSEPVGSVGPKINAADKLGITFSYSNSPVALFCPAQSYPVPAYR